MTEHTFPFKGINQALRRCDLVIDPAEAIFVALCVVLDVAPDSSHSHVHFVNNSCYVFGSPPLRDKSRIGKRSEYKRARHIEFTCHDNVVLSWRSDNLKFCHFSSPRLAVCSAGYPGGQIVLLRTCDMAVTTHQILSRALCAVR